MLERTDAITTEVLESNTCVL